MKRFFLLSIISIFLSSCYPQPKYTLSFPEMYITMPKQNFLIQDEIYEYPLLPQFINVKEIRYECSKAEMKFGELRKVDVIYVLDNTYDNNQLVKTTVYDEDGKLSSMAKYTYDSKGRISNEIIYDEDGEMDIKYTYKYTSNSIVINEAYDLDEAGEDRVFKIDNSGRVLELIFDYGDDDNVIFEYNSTGKISSLRNPDSEKILFKYNERNQISEAFYMKFNYENGILKSIIDNDGGDTWEYVYDDSGLPTRLICKLWDNSYRILDMTIIFND